MPLSNDERGWIMTCLSGLACILGASVICVDIIVRLFPGKKDFRIQDSDTFLSSSLSLSFGVMLFSSLYSMLPSAKGSLIDGGFSPKQASWLLIACFIGGVVGIQVLSRIMHRFMPSHVVDCDHAHDEEHGKEDGDLDHEHHDHGNHDVHDHGDHGDHGHGHSHGHHHSNTKPKVQSNSHQMQQNGSIRGLPTLHSSRSSRQLGDNHLQNSGSETSEASSIHELPPQPISRRPSLHARVTSTLTSLTTGNSRVCDDGGPCYGFSDPCGQECFKNVSARGGYKSIGSMRATSPAKPPMVKSATTTAMPLSESTPLLQNIAESPQKQPSTLPQTPSRYFMTHEHNDPQAPDPNTSASDTTPTAPGDLSKRTSTSPLRRISTTASAAAPPNHHHHVPTNAFLSIGLQTSLAIALHKLPEGFITYATNHANPTLGIAVFLALFIHNITEGFAMALPLYLALNSRPKAMATSFVLGGLSQPLGAGVAALWLKLAGEGDWAPSEGVYGAMFALTAGIMASVALQLFSEALELTHSRHLCFVGAFVGMGVLGVSSALTA